MGDDGPPRVDASLAASAAQELVDRLASMEDRPLHDRAALGQVLAWISIFVDRLAAGDETAGVAARRLQLLATALLEVDRGGHPRLLQPPAMRGKPPESEARLIHNGRMLFAFGVLTGKYRGSDVGEGERITKTAAHARLARRSRHLAIKNRRTFDAWAEEVMLTVRAFLNPPRAELEQLDAELRTELAAELSGRTAITTIGLGYIGSRLDLDEIWHTHGCALSRQRLADILVDRADREYDEAISEGAV